MSEFTRKEIKTISDLEAVFNSIREKSLLNHIITNKNSEISHMQDKLDEANAIGDKLKEALNDHNFTPGTVAMTNIHARITVAKAIETAKKDNTNVYKVLDRMLETLKSAIDLAAKRHLSAYLKEKGDE